MVKLGSGCKNLKTLSRVDFFIILKVELKISPLLERPFCEKIEIFYIFVSIHFEIDSKPKEIYFFVEGEFKCSCQIEGI